MQGRTEAMMATWGRSRPRQVDERLSRRLLSVLDAVTSTAGVIFLMTGVMLGLTISSIASYDLVDLPLRWWLVALSSLAVGAGAWALWIGPHPAVRLWCGLLWAIYGAVRSMSWLAYGSLSGVLAWLPCLLLGLVVFARRHAPPHGGPNDEPPA